MIDDPATAATGARSGEANLTTAETLLQALGEVLAEDYAALNRVATETSAIISGSSVVTETSLAPLEETLRAELDRASRACGMGFVAAPGLVETNERYLMWLQRRAHGPMRLRLNFDPDDPDVYDYLDMGWFTQARAGRPRVVFGPYVDYLGSDQYVFTLTVPVLVDEKFCGVVGFDVPADSQERVLVDVMARCPADALVVSQERRVLAANTGRWVVGSRLPLMPESGSLFVDIAVDESGTGMTVALAGPEG